MDIQEFLDGGERYFLPNLSIDHVIIGYEVGKLMCLLLKLDDKWLLPGGFVSREESVDQASIRILREATHIEEPHLKFFSVFGREDRQFSVQWKELVSRFKVPWKDHYWVNDRFVTLAYYSLINMKEVHPEVGPFLEDIKWFDFDRLPAMWMDHREIIDTARNQLKEDILKEQLSHLLLPSEFTMPELHQLHQHILGQQLDRSRFQKKMLASGCFERLPKRQQDVPGPNPFLYRISEISTTGQVR